MNFLKMQTAKNALWIIGGRVAQMVISFIVSLLTARYLGPRDFGLINYAQTYIGFASTLCSLGINAIIIKNFVDHPEEQGKAIGTAIVLRILCSIFSIISIISIVSIIECNEPQTIVVVSLCCVGLVFQVFDTINCWFQARLLSKVTVAATLLAYIFVSLYKIVLLITNRNVQWFAFSSSVDYIFIALFLFAAYKKYKGPKLSFSWNKGIEMLQKSYHFMMSSLLVAVYNNTDKFMLKQIISNDVEVGYYSAATSLCLTWTFVLTAIIDSITPSIMQLHKTDRQLFKVRNRQLYAMIFYISIFVSLIFTLCSRQIIFILYGSDFLGAINPLRIVTWYIAFSFLGVSRNVWLVCENKQKYLKYIYFTAVGMNIILNLLLIPYWGASGASLASLITQLFTSIVLPLFFRDLRENSIMMLEAIVFYDLKKGRNLK